MIVTMEAYMVVIRPQPHATITSEFNPSAYDILLLDVKLANNEKPNGNNSNSLKQLPKKTISYEQEPAEALFSYLYEITGKDHGGLKGKRAVFIPRAPERNEPVIDSFSDSFTSDTLYCIPIDSRDKSSQKAVENCQQAASFYCLSQVLNTLNSNTYTYCKQTRLLLHRLESWMREKHKMSGAMDILFSTPTEQRLKHTVTNPAFHTETASRQAGQYGGSTSELYNNRSIANEALAKMMSIEKCEITIMNPLFRAGLPYKNRVECSVVNKYWGLAKPDYSKIALPNRHGVKSETIAEERSEDEDSGNNSSDTKGNLSKSTSSRESFTISITDKDTWAPLEGASENINNKIISTNSTGTSYNGSNSSKVNKEMNNLHESQSVTLENEKMIVTQIDSLLERSSPYGSRDDNWLEDFPMHRFAHTGNATGIRELLAQGQSATVTDREHWAPIHYAASNGQLEPIETLLYEGKCSPNITNDHGSTPLHVAATNGHCYVVELLLKHPSIDINAVDCEGNTALKLCQSSEDPDRKACAKLLLRATERPSPEIQVYLMDGTHRMLSLVSGANTTVQQIHQQMMQELDLPESCSHIFTIWICSRNLQLQLKPDHKPIQHLNDWRRKIVPMLTDEDPKNEDPHIFWRRDAILSIEEERKVTNRQAINLLFHEAYHNYIKSLYTCADKDVINLGSILMQLKQGDYHLRKVQNYFASERGLQSLIPVAKLPRGGINWAQQVQQRYEEYSKTLHNKNKSPQVLQQHFLMLCWNLVVYGSAFFTGQISIKSNKGLDTVYIGVNDIGVHIVHSQRKTMLTSSKYKEIEWESRNKMTLEIRHTSGPAKGSRFSIITKQAGLIHHLMSKLAQINHS